MSRLVRVKALCLNFRKSITPVSVAIFKSVLEIKTKQKIYRAIFHRIELPWEVVALVVSVAASFPRAASTRTSKITPTELSKEQSVQSAAQSTHHLKSQTKSNDN